MKNRILDYSNTGQVIEKGSPVYQDIHAITSINLPLVENLNTGNHSKKEARKLIGQIIGQELDETTDISLPFRTDFGRHIQIGKEVFINMDVMFTDLGGITLEDKVLIGPRANLITVNHALDPELRRGLILKPIHIEKNAWIGAGATILPGVRVGENAIVAAGSVVTKDVPANTVVAGVPAQHVRSLP